MESIGIDLGSQGAKFVLLDEDGCITAEEYIPYDIEYPHPYWAEQNPQDWEDALLHGLKRLVNKSGDPHAIKAIGIDAQVDGVVAINRRGRPLYNAIIWMDRRAKEEEALIARYIDPQDLFSITGCNIDASHVLPKILWLKRNIPSIVDTYKFLMPANYVLYLLTGKLGIDFSNASSTLAFDVKKKVWSEHLLHAFNIDISLLPEIFESTFGIGHIKKGMADSIGFRNNRPLVTVGCGDEHAAALGAGVLEEGILFDITGTAEGIGTSSSVPLADKSRLIETHMHASPDHWFLENPGYVSGGNLRWFRDNFCTLDGKGLSYEDLMDSAEKIEPGSDGIIFLPTLMGAMVPEWNSHAKGNIYGFSLNCTRSHITRAILEGSAYGIRDVLERFLEMGLGFNSVRVAGGGSKSRLWNQIKADVLNLPVETLNTPETTSLGAAMLGGVAGGLFGDLKEAVAKVVSIDEIYEPGGYQEVYDGMYMKYKKLYYSLKPVFQYNAAD
jgi:xylulokinase